MIKKQISIFIKDTYKGDPRDPLSLNLYPYCHNEPIMYFDPTGHAATYGKDGVVIFDTDWILKPEFIKNPQEYITKERKKSAQIQYDKNTEKINSLKKANEVVGDATGKFQISKDIMGIETKQRYLEKIYKIPQNTKSTADVGKSTKGTVNPSSQIKGTSYDINELHKTQPYTYLKMLVE